MNGIRHRKTLCRSLVAAAVLQALASAAGATTYVWSAGTFVDGVTAPDPLAAGDTLLVASGGYKYLDNAYTSNGSVALQDNLYFQNGNVLTSNGRFDLQGDVNLLDGGSNGGVYNTGLFLKSAGTGTSNVQINGFSSVGTIEVDSGTLLFSSGASFGNCSVFTGLGTTVIGNGASFAGSLNAANLNLSGGNLAGSAAQINGLVNWTAGTLSGTWTVNGGQNLAVVGGSYKYLNGALVNGGFITATDNLYFQNGNTLTNTGTYSLSADVSLYDGGGNGSFVNQGTLLKTGSSGTSAVSITGFVNSGSIDVESGTLVFNTGAVFNAGTVFTGPGQTVINNGASFNGAFSSNGNLSLSGGTFVGTGAQLNGSATWTAGTLSGDWTVPAGTTLSLQGGSYKYLNGLFTNAGSLVAADNLYFANGNTLVNSGIYQLSDDVGLFDGGGNGYFVNHGTLLKSGGTGTSAVSIAGFSNNGSIDVETGTVVFNAGAVFNAGTVFTGPGQVLINNGASFNGAFSSNGNLTLSGGTFVGTGAQLNGSATWTAGTLNGDWTLPSGQTLSLQSGSYKYINGLFTNAGSLVAADNLYFANGNTLVNNGVYQLTADVGLADGGGNGYFVNNGTLLKSGGGTSGSVVSIAGFSNNGSIDVESGFLVFSNGGVFNAGTVFTGPGQTVISNGASFTGAFSSNGNLLFSGGTFTGGGSSSTATLASGAVAFTSGYLNGQWAVAAGARLNVAPGSYKYVNGTVSNAGTVSASDTLYFANGNTLNNSGSYGLSGDVGLQDGGGNGSFINTGLLTKSAGTGTSSVAGINFVNAAGGVVDVQTGTIALPTNFSNSGTLSGQGSYSVNGSLSNSGHLAPGSMGSAPTLLSLSGNYAQTALGSFDVALSGTSFSSFSITGSASLDGAIDVVCAGACNYAAGTRWVVLQTTGSLSGAFADLVTTGFASGAFDVSYTADEVVLTVTQDTVSAVPEPAHWALLLAGLGAVGFMARRRREG